MRLVCTALLITLPILALAWSPVQSVNDYWGCSTHNPAATQDAPMVLTLVNAEVIDTAVVDIDTLGIQAVEVLCWAKAERMFGVTVKSGVVSIWTHDGPWDSSKTTLTRLVEDQHEYFAEHGGYAPSLAALPEHPIPKRVAVELMAESTGWHATARHDQIDYVCFVYIGSAAAQRDDLKEGEPGCYSQHDHGE